MTNPNPEPNVNLDDLRARLVARRAALFHEIADVADDFRSLEEPDDGERVELAQEEAFERLLDRLDEHAQAIFSDIQRALAKVAGGGYGRCERCGKTIEGARLEAVPETRYCAQCAATVESARARRGADGLDLDVVDESRDPPLPPDLARLADEELVEIVRDELRGRDGLDTVVVEVRKGRVFLHGEVPSDAVAGVASQIVTDRLGLVVFDRMKISREVGEVPDSPIGGTETPVEEPELRRALGSADDDLTTDVVEAEDEGTVYVPPDAPIAEPRK
jgi:RNA polymerase-binding transcription factor DksA